MEWREKGSKTHATWLETASNKGSYMGDMSGNTRDAFLGLQPCLGPVMSVPRSAQKAQIQYQSGAERSQFQTSSFPFEGPMKSPEEWRRMEQVQRHVGGSNVLLDDVG
jgi:hypothetical protein